MAIKDSQIFPINTISGGTALFGTAFVIAFNRFKLVGYTGSIISINNGIIQLRGF